MGTPATSGIGTRVAIGAATAALAVAGTSPAPGLALIAAVGLCVTVVVGPSRASGRAEAVAWTVASVLAWCVGAGVRLAQGPLVLTEVAAAGAVVAALVGLGGWASWRAEEVGTARARGEVARAKLLRSNRELQKAIDESQTTLGTLGAVVDNLADGLVAVDRDGEVALRNPALATVLGVTLPPDGALPGPLRRIVAECLRTAEVATEDLRIRHRAVLAVASPVRHDAGLWGAVVLVRDVTLEREIDRMKSDFIATVSHEMRTPLTSILGFTKVSRNQLEKRLFPHVPAGDPAVERALRTVRGNLDIVVSESQRLSALISDVLDISKIESGQMEWSFAAESPAALVRRAVEATAALFDHREDVVLNDLVPMELPSVRADRDRMIQVLVNLIGNAAKFTDQGAVTLSAVARPGVVEFRVQDTGIGIDLADQAQVFERFKQVGDTLTDRPAGTGLGLPICREIVQHHGGRIWVESEPGRGSMFAFTLPVSARRHR